MTDMDNPERVPWAVGRGLRPAPVAEQGGWGLRGGPIYLSLQKTSASASRLSIYISKSRAPLRLGLYLRKKNAIQGKKSFGGQKSKHRLQVLQVRELVYIRTQS